MARQEEELKGGFESLPLFGPKLSAKLESRILECLDLPSLAGCRMVNTQWRAAVDKLNYFWLLFNRRLGIADACEVGRERLRAEKMLGDCWITCGFCPVVNNASTVERDLKLVSVQRFFYGVTERNFLRVTVFGKASASLYSWRLKLPKQFIMEYSSERDFCISEDWVFLLHIKKMCLDEEPVCTSGSQDVSVIAKANQLNNEEACNIDLKSSLASQEAPVFKGMEYATGSGLFAILPISQNFSGTQTAQEVSPIAIIDLPNTKAVSRCIIRNYFVLLLTQGSIVLYRLPTQPSGNPNQAASILSPNSAINFESSIPSFNIFGLSLQAVPGVSSTSGSENSARFLIFVTAKSELEHVLRIDQVVLNCTNLHTVYSAGALLADSSAFLHSLGNDNCPVFLFIVNAPSPEAKATAQSAAKICKRLRLVRYVPVESADIQATYSSCEYENPFDVNYSRGEFSLNVASFSVGRIFWYGLGYAKADKEPRIVIFRIGYPNALANVTMSSLMVWNFMTANPCGNIQQSIVLNAASWIDTGFEPDNPEQTPLISIWGSNEMHLLLSWRCHPVETAAPVLNALIRLEQGSTLR